MPLGASLWTQPQDQGITRPHCENAVFIVQIQAGIKGACMNHKYLHAINVWTKELEGRSWENFFSHEQLCFELQHIFNFVSSIANLKSQCPPAMHNPFATRGLWGLRNKGMGCCCLLWAPRVSIIYSAKSVPQRQILAGNSTEVCLISGSPHCTTGPAPRTKAESSSDRSSNLPRDTQL